MARDWLDRLIAEHERTLAAGKRVTGCLMEKAVPHINGGLMAHLSLWGDRPSLRHTPPEQAWDMFHAHVLTAEARPTPLILNPYGSTGWTPGVLESLWHGTVWLNSVKDDSALAWAERELVAPRAHALPAGPEADGDETAHATGMRRISVAG